MTKPSTVDEYISAAPEQARAMLRELRAILKEIAPNATEAIKWGVPTLEEKRILFSYAAFKTYLNFTPTRSTLEAFEEELTHYTTAKDTVRLPYDKPLPTTLIKKLANHRYKAVVEDGLHWKYKD